MKKNPLLLIAFISVLLFAAGCLKDENIQVAEAKLSLPDQPYDYETIDLPSHLQVEFDNQEDFGEFNPDFVFFDEFTIPNPKITNDGATLGRVLFYDTRLSINNAVSCASCHRQENAFADPEAGSVGFGGKITPRNSMAIINVALNRNLFWDSRVHSATELVLKPVQNHIEMGMESLDVLVSKLSTTSYYPALFKKAYDSSYITPARISDAMAQFLCSMISADSKFDEGMENGFANYNALEKLGMELFFSNRTKCNQCHSGSNFAAPDRPGGEYGAPDIKGTANTGLDLFTKDEGLGDGQFRIPSLRNIALTAPYMHDGRFANLEEVIEHYDKGIKLHPALDKKLIGEDGEPLRLHLSSLEKQALIAFLSTLTDRSLMTDVRFANPFK